MTTNASSPRVAEHDAVLPLANYPHVARCTACRAYAENYLDHTSGRVLVAATLAHHDSAHLSDPLTLASEHF
jgi:hypothetical protein